MEAADGMLAPCVALGDVQEPTYAPPPRPGSRGSISHTGAAGAPVRSTSAVGAVRTAASGARAITQLVPHQSTSEGGSRGSSAGPLQARAPSARPPTPHPPASAGVAIQRWPVESRVTVPGTCSSEVLGWTGGHSFDGRYAGLTHTRDACCASAPPAVHPTYGPCERDHHITDLRRTELGPLSWQQRVERELAHVASQRAAPLPNHASWCGCPQQPHHYADHGHTDHADAAAEFDPASAWADLQPPGQHVCSGVNEGQDDCAPAIPVSGPSFARWMPGTGYSGSHTVPSRPQELPVPPPEWHVPAPVPASWGKSLGEAMERLFDYGSPIKGDGGRNAGVQPVFARNSCTTFAAATTADFDPGNHTTAVPALAQYSKSLPEGSGQQTLASMLRMNSGQDLHCVPQPGPWVVTTGASMPDPPAVGTARGDIVNGAAPLDSPAVRSSSGAGCKRTSADVTALPDSTGGDGAVRLRLLSLIDGSPLKQAKLSNPPERRDSGVEAQARYAIEPNSVPTSSGALSPLAGSAAHLDDYLARILDADEGMGCMDALLPPEALLPAAPVKVEALGATGGVSTPPSPPPPAPPTATAARPTPAAPGSVAASPPKRKSRSGTRKPRSAGAKPCPGKGGAGKGGVLEPSVAVQDAASGAGGNSSAASNATAAAVLPAPAAVAPQSPGAGSKAPATEVGVCGPPGEAEGEAGGEAGGVAGTHAHQQVERNRRDVINKMIDELRDLIPAGPESPVTHYVRGASGTDRRPKHAVLAETIRSHRALKQAREEEAALRARAEQERDALRTKVSGLETAHTNALTQLAAARVSHDREVQELHTRVAVLQRALSTLQRDLGTLQLAVSQCTCRPC